MLDYRSRGKDIVVDSDATYAAFLKKVGKPSVIAGEILSTYPGEQKKQMAVVHTIPDEGVRRNVIAILKNSVVREQPEQYIQKFVNGVVVKTPI